MEIPFPEWTPDLPMLRNPGATVATNCVPAAIGYEDFPSLTAYSSALDARCRGTFSAKANDATDYTFAADNVKLYALAANAFSDASKTAGYTTLSDAGHWEFVKFGNEVIASSFQNPLQVIGLGNASFSDLATSTLKPKFRHLAAVRDFVMGGYSNDATDGDRISRVWWCAIDDSNDWDPDNATQCDWQDFPEGHGGVMKVVGGEYASIFFEESIYRLTYEGSDTIFRSDQVVKDRGTIASGSVIKVGRFTYFLGNDGWYIFDGTDAAPIGRNKIDKTFLNDFDRARKHLMSAAYDPQRSLLMWAYPGAGNGGVNNRILAYRTDLQKFSLIETNTEALVTYHRTPGETVDGANYGNLALDAVEIAVDDPSLTGGTLLMAAFDGDHKLAYFSGPSLTATVETGEAQPFMPQRTFVNAIRPLVEGADATVTVQVGSRETLAEAVSWGSSESLSEIGDANVLVDSRYMRFRTSIAGGFDHAQGVYLDAQPAGYV